MSDPCPKQYGNPLPSIQDMVKDMIDMDSNSDTFSERPADRATQEAPAMASRESESTEPAWWGESASRESSVATETARLRNLELATGTNSNVYISDIAAVLFAPHTLKEKFPNADTLIIFNLPPGSTRNLCRGGLFPLKLRLPYDSKVLRASGLNLLPKLLDNPRYQKLQRINLKNEEESLDDQYKYLLDLGPSSEEDIRGEHLAALTLPEGVIRWSLMADLHDVPFKLAGGHDDCCCCVERWKGPEVTGGFWDTPLQKFRQLEDYSEVRHIATVGRLLLALAGVGMGLELNSAARVYTIAGLAKIFEIRSNQVFENDAHFVFADELRGKVYDWFSQQITIVEMLPEVMFTIGWNLKIPTITQTAFRILVAEEAIMSEAAPDLPSGRRPQYSPFGRKLGDLDDDVMTTIEHATKSFKDHIAEVHAQLTTPGILGASNLLTTEYQKLTEFGTMISDAMSNLPGSPLLEDLKTAFDKVKSAVDQSFASQVKSLIIGDRYTYTLQDALVLNKGLKDHHHLIIKNLLDVLNPTQKRMTAAHWQSLCEMTPLCPESWITLRYGKMNDAYKEAFDANHIGLFRPQDSINPAPGLVETEESSDGIDAPFPKPFDYRPIGYQVRQKLHDFVKPLYVQDYFRAFELPARLPLSVYLLLGLRQEEFDFLPLWAGGNDDGTGGAFATHLPVAEMGPIGPGPAYTTGLTVASEGGFEHMSQAGTTTAGRNSSAVVQDGVSTVYDRRRVLSESMGVVEEDEGFASIEMGDAEDDDIYGVSDAETEEANPDKGKGTEAQDDDLGSFLMGEDSDDDHDFGNEDDGVDDVPAGDIAKEVTEGIAKMGVKDQEDDAVSSGGSTTPTSDEGFSMA